MGVNKMREKYYRYGVGYCYCYG